MRVEKRNVSIIVAAFLPRILARNTIVNYNLVAHRTEIKISSFLSMSAFSLIVNFENSVLLSISGATDVAIARFCAVNNSGVRYAYA